MANWCGGIKLDKNTLKIINGVICDANATTGLDGRFFKVVKGAVTLQEGFLLTVDVTPKDAIITVTDVDGTEVDPVAGNAKQFLLSGIGDTYTVTATKTGYTTEAKQVKNTGDQTLKIVMKASA
jgi:hypothetical protein